MSLKKGYRYAEIIEGICNTVGKAADNEERDGEKKWQIVFLSGKSY